MRTFQFRRYELEPDGAKDFVAWAVNEIFPLREDFGFTVEWSYFNEAESELVWLASADGTESEFEALSAAWDKSAERAEAVKLMPPALIKINASIVERV
ncbi:MAG TPA: hypothetical protein VIB80_03210 [Aquiluna sp.]